MTSRSGCPSLPPDRGDRLPQTGSEIGAVGGDVRRRGHFRFASQPAPQFVTISHGEPAFPVHRHPRLGPTLRCCHRQREKLGNGFPATQNAVLPAICNGRLLRFCRMLPTRAHLGSGGAPFVAAAVMICDAALFALSLVTQLLHGICLNPVRRLQDQEWLKVDHW